MRHRYFAIASSKHEGHGGYHEAGAKLEYRVRSKGKSTKFADLLWRPRLLLEMKSRGENLERHYQQANEFTKKGCTQRYGAVGVRSDIARFRQPVAKA